MIESAVTPARTEIVMRSISAARRSAERGAHAHDAASENEIASHNAFASTDESASVQEPMRWRRRHERCAVGG